MKNFLFFLLVSFSVYSFSQNNLMIKVSNIESNQGQIVLLLFKKGEDFGIYKKPYKTFIQNQIKDKKTLFDIEDISFGEYAFLVFHDANQDAKFETNWLGLPKEGIGKSGVQGKKPNYKNSKFQYGQKPMLIEINLKYIF